MNLNRRHLQCRVNVFLVFNDFSHGWLYPHFFFQKDPHQTLRELAKMAVMADCTLILAWRSLKINRDFKKSFGINKTKLTLANHIRQIYYNNVSIKLMVKAESLLLVGSRKLCDCLSKITFESGHCRIKTVIKYLLVPLNWEQPSNIITCEFQFDLGWLLHLHFEQIECHTG